MILFDIAPDRPSVAGPLIALGMLVFLVFFLAAAAFVIFKVLKKK